MFNLREFSFLLRINILTCILAVNLLRCEAKLIASSKAVVIVKSLYFEESHKKGRKKCLGVNSLFVCTKSRL